MKTLRLTAAVWVALTSCTFVLDNSRVQCRTDADCKALSPTLILKCDTAMSLCVDSELGPVGCIQDVMSTDYQNVCSASKCEPFDNCARLGLCQGASLPPLINRP
jgi:hypothetical protein